VQGGPCLLLLVSIARSPRLPLSRVEESEARARPRLAGPFPSLGLGAEPRTLPGPLYRRDPRSLNFQVSDSMGPNTNNLFQEAYRTNLALRREDRPYAGRRFHSVSSRGSRDVYHLPGGRSKWIKEFKPLSLCWRSPRVGRHHPDPHLDARI
jgi:hypothetical protein